MLGRILGFIILTFMIAVFYGFFVATVDYANNTNDPVGSGRHASNKIYNLFGVVTEEIKHNDDNATPRLNTSVAAKIAAPYAVTADISALLLGKAENGFSNFVHGTVK